MNFGGIMIGLAGSSIALYIVSPIIGQFFIIPLCIFLIFGLIKIGYEWNEHAR
jgi:hypothetical protein